jgi:hypothetical protein
VVGTEAAFQRTYFCLIVYKQLFNLLFVVWSTRPLQARSFRDGVVDRNSPFCFSKFNVMLRFASTVVKPLCFFSEETKTAGRSQNCKLPSSTPVSRSQYSIDNTFLKMSNPHLAAVIQRPNLLGASECRFQLDQYDYIIYFLIHIS